MRTTWTYRGKKYQTLADVLAVRNAVVDGKELKLGGAKSRLARRKNGNDLTEILDDVSTRGALYTYNDMTLNAEGWSKEIGSSHAWFNDMIRRHGFEKAIHMRPRKLQHAPRIIHCDVEIPTLDDQFHEKNLINSLLAMGLNEQQVRGELEKRARR